VRVRWALLLEYDGSPFVGWQRQASGLSVQEVLETAASRLSGGTAVASAVAGRTDAGVHAAGQVAGIDLAVDFSPARLRDALNWHLKPHPVAVLAAVAAPEGWHPRFSAIGRAYRYDILDRAAPPALLAGRVWHVPHRLDAAAMQAAARVLLGRHDFSSFRASACQAASSLKTLDRLEVMRIGDRVRFVAEARSFLHHQVRNMAGTLKLVGEGRWTAADVARILAARDRRLAGPTAPAQGLCLTGVRYPSELFELARGADQEV
jgi:tRNA pseudouridine38-40 synthase